MTCKSAWAREGPHRPRYAVEAARAVADSPAPIESTSAPVAAARKSSGGDSRTLAISSLEAGNEVAHFVAAEIEAEYDELPPSFAAPTSSARSAAVADAAASVAGIDPDVVLAWAHSPPEIPRTQHRETSVRRFRPPYITALGTMYY